MSRSTWEGLFPRTKPPSKNFMKANVKELRKMQARNKQKELDAQQQPPQPVKPLHSEKYRRVRSKVAGMLKVGEGNGRRGHSLTSLDKLQRSCESGLGASRTPSPEHPQATSSSVASASTSDYEVSLQRMSQSMVEMQLATEPSEEVGLSLRVGAARHPMVSVATSTDDFWLSNHSKEREKHEIGTADGSAGDIGHIAGFAIGGATAEGAAGGGDTEGGRSARKEESDFQNAKENEEKRIVPPLPAKKSSSKSKKDSTTQADPTKAPSGYQKGVVPRYLRDRQEGWRQEEQKRQEEEAQLQSCPPGHIPVSDKERQETLKLLKSSYDTLIKELNTMPLCKDTIRIRQRKVEIEKQLAKLEEGIKVFSRPKVFIKVDT